MKLKLALLNAVFFVAGIFSLAFSQTVDLNGQVKSKSSGEPLAGVTIQLKNSKVTTTTDGSGRFQLSVPGSGSILVITYIGMKQVEYPVEGSNLSPLILMEDGGSNLNEVVVIGYGTQKRIKVSGAVSTVKSEQIEKLKPVRTEEALQGTASGVTVIQNGSPGSKPTIFIRGIASNSGNEPLVVIDGIFLTQVELNAISPSDIESISVLKDPSAIAIYGVKGGNGVILVTTKSGRKNQKTELTVGFNYGMQEAIRKIGVLNATEYGAMVNEGSTLSGGNIIFSDLSKLGVGTNWQDQVFKNASIQNHNIGLRGGTEKMTYFFGGNYTSQGGIVGGDDKSLFRRANFTSNLSFDLTPKLKFLFNTSGILLNSKGIQENSFNSILGSAINFDPTVPINNTVPNTIGQYGFSNLLLSEVFNPLTKLENTYNRNTGFKLYGKFEFQYEIIKNLKVTTRFGYTKYDDNSKSFNPLVFYGLNNTNNTMNADGSTVTGEHNSVSHNKNSNFNYTYEAFANYNFSIKDDHHIEAVAGFTLGKNSGNAAGATRQDVPFNSWTFADYTAATGTNNSTNSNASNGYYYQYFSRNSSTFARLNYDFKDKYLFSFTGRRDGSSVFGANNKFGFFPAVSAGWVVSKENFFNSKVIDLLKLRVSAGRVGNDQITPASFVSIVTGGPSYGPTGNSNGYTFGGVFFPGSTVGSLKNENVKWESVKQTNIGFDMGLLKNKLTITFDYYTKGSSGLLFLLTPSLYTGTLPRPFANIGTTKTSGIDLQISYNEKIGRHFQIGNSFNFTTIKNEVTATNDDGTSKLIGGYYFNGQSQSVTVFEKGQAPGYFYGYKTMGLFQNAAEIAKAPKQAGAQPGDIRFADINGDGIINDADQTNIGNPFPKFVLGWNLNIVYKNVDLTAFVYASIGNDIYRAYERNANFTNKDRSVLARWTGEGSTNNAKNPRYSFTDANNNARVSDRYVEDGSFVKLKNIQLGYTLPERMFKNVFKKIRVYAQVRNAFVLTKYAGFDPEIGGGLMESGIDRGAYPQPRTYAFGIDFKL